MYEDKTVDGVGLDEGELGDVVKRLAKEGDWVEGVVKSGFEENN